MKEGGYSVSDTEALFKAGDSGVPPINVHEPQSSEIIARMTSHDSSIRMPLDSEPLHSSDVNDIRTWIASGAKVGEKNPASTLLELYGKARQSAIAPDHYPSPIPISTLLLSPDGRAILVAGYGEVLIWNVDTGAMVDRMPTRGRFLSDLVWAPGGRLVVASGAPGQFGVLESFDFQSRLRLAAFGFSTEVCSSLAASPYRNEIAAGFANGSVAIFSLENHKPRVVSVAHAAAVTSVDWSSRNDRLFSSSLDRSAKSFETMDGQLLFAYADHERSVGGVVDTQFGAVTLDETGALKVWSEGEETRPMTKQEGFAQIVRRIRIANGVLLIAEKDRIRRVVIEQDEVDDDRSKDKEKVETEKAKKKKRTRFKELEPLQSIPNQRILSFTSNGNNLVAAGLENGIVVLWRMDQSTALWKKLLSQP